MNKLVSVIVTTKNEAVVIGRLLESVKKQTYRKTELIVVDNRSTDQTRKIAKQFTKSVFTAGPERSAQRNFGAKKANGIYLFFIDADMELSKKVVENCVKALEKSKKNGMVVVPEESIAIRFWERVKAYERSFYNSDGDSQIEAARFFRAKDFWSIGGYDEEITGPEDWDMPERLKRRGFRSVRIREVIYHHERVRSVWDLARKKYYYGLKAHTYMAKNHVSVVGAKTIYILRPVFYRQWRKLVTSPLLSLAMFYMLMVEQISGGWGYLYGRLKNL